MLDLWKDAHVQSELDGSGWNIVIYRRLADRLARACGSAKGDRMAESCRNKIKSLTQAYKKCRDHNRLVNFAL